MEKKIHCAIRIKGLLDLANALIDPSFTKEILKYSNTGKLKPPTIGPYDGIKDPINNVQNFSCIYTTLVLPMPLYA